MSSTTINLSDCTWFQVGSSSNHYGDTWLKCSARSRGAVLQFSIPNTLKYKRITSVVLSYYSRHIVNGVSSNEKFITGMWASPYVISSSALSQVTGVNYWTIGEMGDEILVEPVTNYGTSGWEYYPRWRTADITSIFASNLYNNSLFTVILVGYPGIADESSRAGDVGGVGSGYAPYLTLTYEDITQLPPTPSYPSNNYIFENTDILFSWAWNSSTAAVQAAVQLEYKLASAANWTVLSLTQTAHTYKLTGGLPQGAYVWRIKGTNDASETSAYSNTAEFTVIGKPAAPVINAPANKALTEITWQASDQNSFDITLTDSNGVLIINETVGSTATSYKPNVFLKGTYTVGIRYRNSTGMSSDWSYKAFSITAAGPAKPTMTLYVDGSKVYVNFTPVVDTDYYLIRQEDGGKEELAQDPAIVALGRFEDTTYKFFVPYRYVLRAYAGAGYTDSDPVRIKHGINAVVLDTEDEEIILDKSEETFLPYIEDATGEIGLYNTVGRDYPLVEHNLFESWQFSSALHVSEKQKERLRIMAKKNEIYYRDYSGRGFPVAIVSVNYSRWQKDGYIATINFVRVAGKELKINV